MGSFCDRLRFCFRLDPLRGSDSQRDSGLCREPDSVTKGIILLAIYSLGLAVPFLLTSLGIQRFLKFYSRFRAHMHAVEVASGGIIDCTGCLVGIRTIYNDFELPVVLEPLCVVIGGAL